MSVCSGVWGDGRWGEYSLHIVICIRHILFIYYITYFSAILDQLIN